MVDAPEACQCQTDGVAVLGDGQEEVHVHSQVLCLASPMFDAMLQSGMQERSTKRFKVDGASAKEFRAFYSCMLPFAKAKELISEANVDTILALSDYYQVPCIKSTCADVYRELPITASRLQLAKKHGLDEVYKKWCNTIAEDPQFNLEELQGNAEVLMDLALCMRSGIAPRGRIVIRDDAHFKSVLEAAHLYAGNLPASSNAVVFHRRLGELKALKPR
mmetsp:Transcript_125649/g.355419  ORF Transcript_125649/g.355419 Transcript_125649/m.355419 type:complete len:219 (-) Transcript_125649:26-682(-)